MGDGYATLDDRQLVELARGDAEAFAELYRRHLPRIHAFALRRTGRPEVAEDLTAATFERALRSLHQFRWRAGGFEPWLFRIMANELVDHRRRAAREGSDRAIGAQRAFDPSPPPDPADAAEAREAIDRMRQAMDRLNPRYQRALALRFLAGLDADQAAAAMGLPKPVMAVVVHRAVRALRRAMESDA